LFKQFADLAGHVGLVDLDGGRLGGLQYLAGRLGLALGQQHLAEGATYDGNPVRPLQLSKDLE